MITLPTAHQLFCIGVRLKTNQVCSYNKECYRGGTTRNGKLYARPSYGYQLRVQISREDPVQATVSVGTCMKQCALISEGYYQQRHRVNFWSTFQKPLNTLCEVMERGTALQSRRSQHRCFRPKRRHMV